jgi:RHS repeat-associated protein
VAATATYDPYGQQLSSTGVANPLGYAGQYTDAESGLQYLRARYYDPATAQFLTKDPLVAITQEPYAYVGNNPLNATDPSGLICRAGYYHPYQGSDDCIKSGTGIPPPSQGNVVRGGEGIAEPRLPDGSFGYSDEAQRCDTPTCDILIKFFGPPGPPPQSSSQAICDYGLLLLSQIIIPFKWTPVSWGFAGLLATGQWTPHMEQSGRTYVDGAGLPKPHNRSMGDAG